MFDQVVLLKWKGHSISKACTALAVVCYLNDAINIPSSNVAANPQLARLELPLLRDAQGRSVYALEMWVFFYCQLIHNVVTFGI